MAITIVPATSADAHILTPIGVLAFRNDLLNNRLENYETSTPAERDFNLQWRIKRSVKRMAGPGKHWFQAIDQDSGKPVGYTGVMAPEKGKVKGLLRDDDTHEDVEMPPTINLEVHREICEHAERTRKEHMGDRDDYWYVASMCVHPDFQGKGIAKRLLQKECELADAAGQDIYLEATAAGKRLYAGAGFETLGTSSVLNGEYELVSMVRKAKV